MGNSVNNEKLEYEKITKELNSLNSEFTISIIGNTNAGKSSLLNLLIGENLLPVNYKAQTSKPLKIIHTNSNKNELFINNTKITMDIKEELNNIDKHMRNNEDSHFNSSRLMLKTGVKLLSQNNLDLDAIEIYDMPGFSENKNFPDEETKNIIEKSKLILFMIDISRQDDIEIKINYMKILELNKNIILVANQIDKCDDSLDSIKKDIFSSFRKSGIILNMDRIIPISAKNDKNINVILNELGNEIRLSKNYVSNKVIEIYYKTAEIFFTTNNSIINKHVILPEKIKNDVDNGTESIKILGNILLGLSGVITSVYSVPIGLGICTLSMIIDRISRYGEKYHPSEILLEINKFSGFDKYYDKYNIGVEYKKSFFMKHKGIYQDKLLASDGKHIIYEGEFMKLKYHGNGILYYPNNNKFIEGEFKNGEINGYAKIYYPDGEVLFDGKIKRIEKIKSIIKTKIKGIYFSMHGNNRWNYNVNHVF